MYSAVIIVIMFSDTVIILVMLLSQIQDLSVYCIWISIAMLTLTKWDPWCQKQH